MKRIVFNPEVISLGEFDHLWNKQFHIQHMLFFKGDRNIYRLESRIQYCGIYPVIHFYRLIPLYNFSENDEARNLCTQEYEQLPVLVEMMLKSGYNIEIYDNISEYQNRLIELLQPPF